MKHRLNILFLATSIVTISFLFQDSPWFIWLILVCFLVFFINLSLGVLFLRFNYFLTSTIKINNEEVLLTFDDGPEDDKTTIVLDVLKEQNVKALFFLIGSKARTNPEIVQRIKAEGHLIGNHSYSHNNFMSLFPSKKLKEELIQSQEVIKDIVGINSRYFRPPVGYTNPNYARVLHQLKLKCIGWSVRSYDSVITEPNKLVERLLKLTKPGDIVLLHDNRDVTIKALDEYISKAKTNGIKFVSSDTIDKILDA